MMIPLELSSLENMSEEGLHIIDLVQIYGNGGCKSRA